MFPFPRTDLFHGLCDRGAERCVAVQHSNTDLEFGNLTVEVPRHEPLAQQFDTMHLRFDAAPSLPKGPAEVFGSPQGLVSRGGTGGDGLPWLRIFAGWDKGRGAAIASWHLRVS